MRGGVWGRPLSLSSQHWRSRASLLSCTGPPSPSSRAPCLGGATSALRLGEDGKKGPRRRGDATARAGTPDDSQARNALGRGSRSGTAPCSAGAAGEDPGPGGWGGEGKAEGQEAEPPERLQPGARIEGKVTERCLREGRQGASPLPSWP